MATGEADAPARLVLGLRDRGRILTDDEFAEADHDEPWRYELVDGRLVVMSPNGEAHDDHSESIRDAFTAYKFAHRDRIEKVVAESWVLIGTRNQCIGDLGIFLVGDRSGQPRPGRVPEIMIEVVSKGRRARKRDYVQKRVQYHAIGVLEYLIVDPKADRVVVLSHRPGDYAERVLTASDFYTTPLLPGLEISIAEVFRP